MSENKAAPFELPPAALGGESFLPKTTTFTIRAKSPRKPRKSALKAKSPARPRRRVAGRQATPWVAPAADPNDGNTRPTLTPGPTILSVPASTSAELLEQWHAMGLCGKKTDLAKDGPWSTIAEIIVGLDGEERVK